jgi:hypothetical protein
MGNVLSRSFKLQQQQGVILSEHADVCDNLYVPKLDLYPDMHEVFGSDCHFTKSLRVSLQKDLTKYMHE